MIFIIMILAALIFLTNTSLRPVVEEMVSHKTQVYATQLINSAMLEQLEHADFSYDRLVKTARDETGEIKSLETDMLQINRLKSMLGKDIAEKLELSGNQKISIPVGTIIGNEFTSGLGPLIEVRVTPIGYVQTEIYNRFSSAGINQTLHQIMLRVTVQMISVLPGYRVKTETQTSFCIAETVIVGEIPQGYANFADSTAAFAPITQ